MVSFKLMFERAVTAHSCRYFKYLFWETNCAVNIVVKYLQVGRVLFGRVSGIQGLCGGKVAETETK